MSSRTYHSCFQCKAEGQSQPMGWWPKPVYKLLSLAFEFNGLRSLEIIKKKTQQIAIKDLGTSARKLPKKKLWEVHSSWFYLTNIQRASNSNRSGMNNGSQTSKTVWALIKRQSTVWSSRACILLRDPNKLRYVRCWINDGYNDTYQNPEKSYEYKYIISIYNST